MPDYTKKVTPAQALDIHRRVVSGESKREIAMDFGISERTVGRYQQKSLAELELLFEESLKGKPARPRGKSYSAPFTRADEPIDLPSSRLNIARGGVTITPEGSCLQTDSSGRLRRVLRCPIYSQRWMCVRVADIDVLSLDGSRGRGRVTSRDGLDYEGNLIFETRTIKHMDWARMVTRVEFHPD